MSPQMLVFLDALDKGACWRVAGRHLRYLLSPDKQGCRPRDLATVEGPIQLKKDNPTS